MHHFVTDETNKNPVSGQFFIYGGLVVTEDQLVAVHKAVATIRTKYGYRAGDSFKFNTKSKPDHITPAVSRAAKQELVEQLHAIGVRMIVYVILHDIAAKKTASEVMNYALNTVAARYHRMLQIEDAMGTMTIDRSDDQHGHLTNLFQYGITIGEWSMPLDDRITSFSMTADNSTHLSSAVDIALGAFRYCVNAAGGDGSEVVAADIFSPLAQVIWGVEVDGVKHLGGYGYIKRPEDVRAPSYAEKYSHLAGKLDKYSGGTAEERKQAPAA